MSNYAVKVKNGKAEIYDANTGVLKRYIGSGVVSAQINGEILQVNKDNGKIEIYDINTGILKRTL